MDKENDQFGQNDAVLTAALTQKQDYLKQLNESITNGKDVDVYELMDPNRFATEFKGEELTESKPDFFDLAADLHQQLSHHLSNKLIDYLSTTYPFFYYHEYELGKFRIFFGNWWNHQVFGELDVLNLRFDFAQDQFDELDQSFKLEVDGKQVHGQAMQNYADQNEKITELINNQDERDKQKDDLRTKIKANEEKSPMPWEAGKVKEEHHALENQLLDLTKQDDKAASGRDKIKENKERILALSKEETILNLEKQNIRATFGSFEGFLKSNDNLYKNYLESLSNESQVKGNA